LTGEITVPIAIDSKLLKQITPLHRSEWRIWQKKNLNMHRGVVELTANRVKSIDDLAADVRDGVRREFSPGLLRGFGFGAIIHFIEVPADFVNICRHVDTRNRRHGVWQWVIACLDEDGVAVAIHTWQHGYLRSVYDAVMKQLSDRGYQCQDTDTDVDALIAKLHKIVQIGRLIKTAGLSALFDP
jgi:hypothetical protein